MCGRFYPKDGHMNTRGNESVAQALWPWLRANLD